MDKSNMATRASTERSIRFASVLFANTEDSRLPSGDPTTILVEVVVVVVVVVVDRGQASSQTDSNFVLDRLLSISTHRFCYFVMTLSAGGLDRPRWIPPRRIRGRGVWICTRLLRHP